MKKSLLPVRFVRDVMLTGGTQVVQAALAMVAGILVARYLGASGKGQLSVLVALGSMAVLLASLGLHFSAVYFLGKFKGERESIIANIAFVGLLGGVVTAGLLGVVGMVFHGELLGGISLGLFLLYVLSVPPAYFNSLTRGVLLGAGRIGVYNLRDLIEGGGLLMGTVAGLVLFGPRLGPLVALRVLIEFAVAVVLFLYVRRMFAFGMRPSRRLLRRQVAYGLRNYASSLLWLFLLQSDIILCNHFLGSGPTGIYSVAVSVGLPVTLLASTVGTLTFQRVSSTEGREERVANTNRTLRVMLPIVVSLAVTLGVTAGWIVPLLYGSQFEGATKALIVLLPGLCALSLELVAMNFLAGEGSPPIVYQAPFVGLLLNGAANLFVIPRWGITGAAATSSVAYCVVLVLIFRHYLTTTGSSLSDVALSQTADLRALIGADGESAPASAAPRRA